MKQATLSIVRVISGDCEDRVRITIKLPGRVVVAQGECSLEQFAQATFGTAEVPLSLEKPE